MECFCFGVVLKARAVEFGVFGMEIGHVDRVDVVEDVAALDGYPVCVLSGDES